MGFRVGVLTAVVLLVHACGGDEFSDSSGTGGSGAVSGSGGSGGSAGSGGSGGSAGSSGASGASGAGGGASDAGSDGSADAPGDAPSDAGPPAIAIVQVTPTKTSKAPLEQTSKLTLTAAPKPGNAIIVGISCISDYGVVIGDGGGAIVNGDCLLDNGAVTDNQGNSYVRVVQGAPIKSSHQAARGYLFIAQSVGAPSGAFTIDVNPEGESAMQAIVWGAIEVAGLSAPPSVDANGYTASASETSTTAKTFAPTTQANELAVAVLTIRHNETFAGIAHDGTWTGHHIQQDSTDGPPAHSMVSKILTSAGTASHKWDHADPSRGAAGIIATFRGAAAN